MGNDLETSEIFPFAVLFHCLK